LKLEYEDRCRIAKELRESTAQELAALKINLGVIRKSGSKLGPRAEKALSECLTLAEKCGREIRNLSDLLHPPLLEEFGLASALRGYIEGLAKRSGLRAGLAIDDCLRRQRWPRELELTLFLVAQEELANVLHAGSKAADVELRRDLRSNCIVLKVKDARPRKPTGAPRPNRIGLAASSRLSRLRMAGIKERVRRLGGRFAVEITRHDTVLTVALPLA